MNSIERTRPEVVTEVATHAHTDAVGARVGMWLFLLTEILLFGALFLLYSVYRSEHMASFHEAAAELNVTTGAVNTIVLLSSSLSMALSIAAMRMGKSRRASLFLVLTILLAVVFLVNKYFEWGAKIAHGIYPGSPELAAGDKGRILFYGLYYVMTGLHGLHVVIGIILLSVMLVLVHRGNITRADYAKLENSGLYWHLVDIIWIYLFPLYYLIT
jgi:cytochrome c oxidase subunit 3